MNAQIKNLKNCIKLNGINAFIQWKAEVIKETYYDEDSHPYTHIHPVYEYLLKLASYGPFPKWELN